MAPPNQVLAIETISRADASVGWCAMIGCDSGIYAAHLPRESARQVFPKLDSVTAGMVAPTGRATRVPGGYSVTGQWRFASGSTHTDWLVGGCSVFDRDQPVLCDDGRQEWRIVMARPEQFRIADRWTATGLEGTGSQDYSATELFVPETHTFRFGQVTRPEPLYSTPDAILRKMPGVPLGAARAALDYTVGCFASSPSTVDAPTRMLLADATSIVGAYRAYVLESLETQWHSLVDGKPLSSSERAGTALARLGAFRGCRRAVQLLYESLGSAAVFREETPIDRIFRDLTTMSQHAVAQHRVLTASGGLLLGENTKEPFI